MEYLMNSELTERKEVILSGIRATGALHLGNYLGAVEHFVEFQRANHLRLYFVADWHSMTTDHDPKRLRREPIEIVKDYIAAGLDPERSIIYVQSSVPELLELTWYLATLQMVPELSTLPDYVKHLERIAEGKESPKNNNLCLLSYPILMAADILGPKATLVPVGKDQTIHVRLAGKLARRFNNEYGEYFPIPQTIEGMIKVPGLDGEKMGKSESDNAVDIHLTREEMQHRYRKDGITDKNRKLMGDPGDPYHGCKSVYPVHELVTAAETETREIATLCQHAQIGCVECKTRLVDSIWKKIGPFQEKRETIKNEDVFEILNEGGKKARRIISNTLLEVRERMGVRIY